jgi:hypothetical protein
MSSNKDITLSSWAAVATSVFVLLEDALPPSSLAT